MTSTNLDSLLERALLAIDDNEWNEADRLLERALDDDYKCAKAYILKFLVSQKAKNVSDLICSSQEIQNDGNIKKALRFAQGEDKATLDAILASASSFDEKLNILIDTNRQTAVLTERLQPFTLLRSDGTVGTSLPPFKAALNWSNIVSICIHEDMLVGVRADGTLVICGDYCKRYFTEANELRDIVKVDVSDSWLVALDKHGKLHICGDDFSDDFDCYEVEHWTDIVDFGIGTDGNGMYAITKDGKVKKTGTLFFYTSDTDREYDESPIEAWTDIKSIYVGSDFALGLRNDGHVVACGNNDVGQCGVSQWENIVQIFASFSYSVALRSDGRLVYCGSNEGLSQVADISYLKSWKDVRYFAMSLDSKHAIGIKNNGTVEHYGWDTTPNAWTDIAAVTICSDEAIAVTNDGRILSTFANTAKNRDSIQCIYLDAKIFDDVKDLDKEFEQKAPEMEEKLAPRRKIRSEQKKLRRKYMRREKYLCQHCGGHFKGTWNIVCESCGKKLDYKLPKKLQSEITVSRIKSVFKTAIITAMIGALVAYGCMLYKIYKYEQALKEDHKNSGFVNNMTDAPTAESSSDNS